MVVCTFPSPHNELALSIACMDSRYFIIRFVTFQTGLENCNAGITSLRSGVGSILFPTLDMNRNHGKAVSVPYRPA